MRKRAGLARALALDPDLLFLDEPTAGLDPISASAFDRLIGDLQRSLGLTVVMVTHDLDSLLAICDRIAVLVDKQVESARSRSTCATITPGFMIISTVRGGGPQSRQGHCVPPIPATVIPRRHSGQDISPGHFSPGLFKV